MQHSLQDTDKEEEVSEGSECISHTHEEDSAPYKQQFVTNSEVIILPDFLYSKSYYKDSICVYICLSSPAFSVFILLECCCHELGTVGTVGTV